MQQFFFWKLLLLLGSLFSPLLSAAEAGMPAGIEKINELFVSLGSGRQPNAEQKNRLVSLDYNFIRLNRSPRSGLSLGISYTQLRTNFNSNRRVEVLSLYPQLTLRPVSKFLKDKYFFVRALGPSYISDNKLGERRQSRNFSFLAQVGVGMTRQVMGEKEIMVQISWRHFSNANLFEENEAFDVPFVFSLGYSF